jgi:hypothetical protein
MHVSDGHVHEAVERLPSETFHVFLSLREIPDDVRRSLESRGVVWIEIARKERSRLSNELGENVFQFIKRYGVRTLREPRAKRKAHGA